MKNFKTQILLVLIVISLFTLSIIGKTSHVVFGVSPVLAEHEEEEEEEEREHRRWPTPRPTQTPTPSLTPSVTPTPTPTVTADPTNVPTPIPTVLKEPKKVKSAPVEQFETRIIKTKVIEKGYNVDSDKDGLVDALDPDPIIHQSKFFTDSDDDQIPDAFDNYPGLDDFKIQMNIDENENGILDLYE